MAPRALRIFTIALTALGLAACKGNDSTSFPPGLEPLEDDSAPPPDGTADDPYPEKINIVPGQDGDANYVHATAFVHASVSDTWAAFKDPEVVVDRHDITKWSVTQNVEPGYDVSFLTHYEIDKVVEVDFDLTWRQGVVTGTTNAPTQVSVVYKKTYGSEYVELMQGSFELVQVTPTVTKIEFAQRMQADETTVLDIVKWTSGLYSSVLAQVHGQPLP